MRFDTRIFLALASPLRSCKGIGHRLRLRCGIPPHALRMREVAGKAPLVLQIETTNLCNARCVFCAYPGMKRPKGIMSLSLFEQVVRDYCEMGGGPVSLTPVVGDALLDPHLLQRLAILGARPEISQISLTTNGIALDRYSDEELSSLLAAIDCIQVSIGGLDGETYRTLYGVDRFSQVERGMKRLLDLRDAVPDPPQVSFAFRTNDWKFEFRYRKRLAEFRRRGVFVSHISSYANYAGAIQGDEGLKLTVIEEQGERRHPCIYASVHMAVCWDGTVTACGCADFEASALRIGDAGKEVLPAIWSGGRRTAILNSFAQGRPPGICRKCSAYLPDVEIFSQPYCRKIVPHGTLPPEYFQQFWGG